MGITLPLSRAVSSVGVPSYSCLCYRLSPRQPRFVMRRACLARGEPESLPAKNPNTRVNEKKTKRYVNVGTIRTTSSLHGRCIPQRLHAKLAKEQDFQSHTDSSFFFFARCSRLQCPVRRTRTPGAAAAPRGMRVARGSRTSERTKKKNACCWGKVILAAFPFAYTSRSSPFGKRKGAGWLWNVSCVPEGPTLAT